ncbi:hypothetical protein HYW67_00120 [Candidatus Parcubacteria bacterium]|nr:hypothetical protein [Candidatus Parcubacteria bacterium]
MVKVRVHQQRDVPEQHLPIRKEDKHSRIAALFPAVGVMFSPRDIEEVVSEIRSNGHDATLDQRASKLF